MQYRFENNFRKFTFVCISIKDTPTVLHPKIKLNMTIVKILKSHGNGQSGESFGHCIRCDFVMSIVLHEFEDSPSALRINSL